MINGQRTTVINGIMFITLMNILNIKVGTSRNSLLKQIIIETKLKIIPKLLMIIERMAIMAFNFLSIFFLNCGEISITTIKLYTRNL